MSVSNKLSLFATIGTHGWSAARHQAFSLNTLFSYSGKALTASSQLFTCIGNGVVDGLARSLQNRLPTEAGSSFLRFVGNVTL